MPRQDTLPDTLKRSPKHAQEIWLATLDNAIKEYGDNDHAYRTAWAAVEKQYEKSDDRWVKKD